MNDAADRFIEAIGQHLEAEGEPRIAGRLFGLLMVSEEAQSLDDVAARLRVSKGSASSNARLLERWGVAERVTRPGDRRDYYRVAPEMGVRYMERLIARGERMLTHMRAAEAAPDGLSAPVRQRFRRTIATQERALRVLTATLPALRDAGGE